MINILSLFDGCSGAYLALKKANININNYFASEVNKYPISVSKKNFSDIHHLGDCMDWAFWNLPKIDLLIGGSPCQGFSFAGKQLNFKDARSKLVLTFIDCLKFYKPKYFLLENVVMKKEYQDIISNMLGVKPIMINSSLVSAQNRKRLYWTNIPGVKHPEDKRIRLKDIIELDAEYGLSQKEYNSITDPIRLKKKYTAIDGDKALTLMAGYLKWNGTYISKCMQVGMADDIKGYDCIRRIYSPEGKSPCLTTCTGGHRQPKVALNKSFYRKLTPLECERLQTLPDNYTQSVSNSQRYKMIGNGFTVDVIAHILTHIKKETK